MRPLLLASLAICGAAALAGPLSFDVASVKPAEPDANGRIFAMPPSGGPGTNDPGKIQWTGATLMNLVVTAYEVKPYQVTGPDWMRAERFNVTVTIPSGATKDQVPAMWRSLL